MARIRSTHPGQWTDGDFVSCSPLARLLALAVRNEADDNGIFEVKPVELKIRYLAVDNCNIGELIAELEEHRQIRCYSSGGRRFALIRNFQKYQNPKYPKFLHPTPDASALDPEGGFSLHELSGSASGAAFEQPIPFPDDSGNASGRLPEDSGNPPEIGLQMGVQDRSTGGREERDADASLARSRQAPASGPHPDEVVLEFPLHRAGSTWPLTKSKLAEYRRAFPYLDVLAALRVARQWLVDNPGKRKTERGMARFCFSWLSRDQDRGRGGGPPPRLPPADGPSNEDLMRQVGWEPRA